MTSLHAITAESQPKGTLTELVLTQGAADSWAMVMPMIAHLSHQSDGRWLTWITRETISHSLLERFGVDTSRLRLVHCKDDAKQLWVSWDALALGNSHTVIASPGRLGKQELAQLESAAMQGRCQGLLLRER
ncbi:SulA-like leucine-rich domain-containing protein [Gilvimarinus sp. SDUM040013]|uniref:SulA-like leucine-rich domain-containing protein n=1 Tax=Gilvimarinus gilvus TaxID=3058038 RepID=A0ABU4RXR2_9GAMM|nr:SulA-like leucine-rich domain-containing protein [Gilvimarinus sp. SDUM040013]MDO3386392.1 SulA-like leucine-rich domain-containing protein [Gilvimarinus sp. SDUM040013]MDX6849658.1 SulA-like leucine-rich domain-containing protein [Gilvimarinus sp. SDUM040013]